MKNVEFSIIISYEFDLNWSLLNIYLKKTYLFILNIQSLPNLQY